MSPETKYRLVDVALAVGASAISVAILAFIFWLLDSYWYA